MHDPKCVAFEIKSPFKDKGGYRNPIITIWHNDPEKDGTDDSCGWFIRLRHTDKAVYEKIVKEFEFEWDRTFKSDSSNYVYNCGWFNPEGENVLSVQAIVFNMYLYAAKEVINADGKMNPRKCWKKAWKFMNKWRSEIFYFAENNRDSMRDTIVRKFERGTNEDYTPERRMEMIRNCASIIYTDILRKQRPWYKHPRWHIHHWSIQIHPLQQFKRRWIDKCSKCGKRGFKGSPYSDWGGTKIWCEKCNVDTVKSVK